METARTRPDHGAALSALADPQALAAHIQVCRARLGVLRDEIASLRLQIAAADIRRQMQRRAVEVDTFHRMKTALRARRREADQVALELARFKALALHSKRRQRPVQPSQAEIPAAPSIFRRHDSSTQCPDPCRSATCEVSHDKPCSGAVHRS